MGTCGGQNKRKTQFSLNNLPYKIHILSYIWNENGHNLFDYESDKLAKKELEIDFQARIVQVDKDIIALTKTEFVKHQSEIFELKCEEKSVQISPMESKSDNSIWRVVRPLNASDLPTIERYKLGINNVIKLGRVKLILKDYSFQEEEDKQNQIPDEIKDFSQSKSLDSNLPDCQYVCRICLSKLATLDNPFISPCQCSGSMKFLHLKCLQNWINSNIKIKQQNGISLYYWRSLKCELCKTNYKTDFKYQEFQYTLLDIPRPKGPFLMFEINHVDKNKEKGFYIVEIKDKTLIKIGRTQDCDIKLHDISVSRHHATIIVNQQENCLYIEDNSSKFGTLIKATQSELTLPFVIKESIPKKFTLQAGRIVVIVSLDKKNKNFLKYRVPNQIEVYRQLQIPLDENDSVSLVNEKDNQKEGDEEILINDPNFIKDQELQKLKYANYLSGSLYMPVNNQQMN